MLFRTLGPFRKGVVRGLIRYGLELSGGDLIVPPPRIQSHRSEAVSEFISLNFRSEIVLTLSENVERRYVVDGQLVKRCCLDSLKFLFLQRLHQCGSPA